MSISGLSNAPIVLLVDSDNTVRGTVASVCRDLNVARVIQATSVAQAVHWLNTGSLKGLVLSMREEDEALALLTNLRAGDFPCGPDVAVAVMAHTCTPELARQLKQLGVRRLLLQPFKLRDVIQTLEGLWTGEASKDAKPARIADAVEPNDGNKAAPASEAVEPGISTEAVDST